MQVFKVSDWVHLKKFLFLLLFVGRSPLRETPCRGRKDPPEISGPSSSHRREGP
jgi:hypothetical protein